MNHPIHSFLPGGFLGAEKKNVVQKIAEDCTDFGSANFDTKTGREQAFKSSAQCAAETACAVYSKGVIPAGVCSSIAGPIADVAIKAWNSIFGDNEEAERAKIRDANTAKFFSALNRLRAMDAAWVAYSRNTITRLIQFHDQNLPSLKGAWGGGALTKEKTSHADLTKPGIPTEYQTWDYERYSNFCPVFERLVKLNGLPTKKPPAGVPGLCNGWTISSLYYESTLLAPDKQTTVDKTKQINALVDVILPEWIAALDKAANTLRNEVVMQAVKNHIDAQKPKPSKIPIVVGGAAVVGGLTWWAWSKGLLKGVLG